MTQAELDALLETGGYNIESRTIDGRQVKVAVARRAFALFQKPDDPIDVMGSDGQRYMVGWANGIRYKSRRPRI